MYANNYERFFGRNYVPAGTGRYRASSGKAAPELHSKNNLLEVFRNGQRLKTDRNWSEFLQDNNLRPLTDPADVFQSLKEVQSGDGGKYDIINPAPWDLWLDNDAHESLSMFDNVVPTMLQGEHLGGTAPDFYREIAPSREYNFANREFGILDFEGFGKGPITADIVKKHGYSPDWVGYNDDGRSGVDKLGTLHGARTGWQNGPSIDKI